jgi:hypothetical protein
VIVTADRVISIRNRRSGVRERYSPAMRWLLACLLATGCGRLGFDSRFQLAGDDTVMPDGAANLVFVTSQHVVAGQLGSLAGADAVCNEAAAAAGLPGRYVAWLSTSKTSAIDRLAGARGWVRPDGRPFADTPADIAAGRIWYPASIDENGAVAATTVVTTSDAHGRFDGKSCNDLTDDSIDGSCDIGESTGTAGTFSSYPLLGGLCFVDEPMYCFATDRNVRVRAPQPRTGVRVFPAEGFTPGGGLAGADALCARTAADGGVSGTFRALLATAAMPAAARFDPAAGPVVRPDGIAIAASVGDLLAGKLASAANATLDGRYLGGPVWTGADDPVSPAQGAPCGDWAKSDASAGAMVGELASAQAGFFGLIDLSGFHVGRNKPCNSSLPIYCLEH